MANKEEIIITNKGIEIARIISPKQGKKRSLNNLVGILPSLTDEEIENIKNERIFKQWRLMKKRVEFNKNYLLVSTLFYYQIHNSSASFVNWSLNAGCAILINALALSPIVKPLNQATPYSVTT